MSAAPATTRRTFLMSAGSTTAAALAAPRPAPARPNVVFFLTDDHGAWATGAYGARDIRTPHIDALARTGARFTQAFAATPVCSPSRMTYMTGCLPSTHGVQDWLVPEDSFGPQSRDWLAGRLAWSDVLARAGYTLGMTGKWHMGRDDQAQHGFTEWATVPGGGGTYLRPTFVHNGRNVRVDGFKEDAIGDFALEFLEAQKPGRPFCLYVPFYAPHTPYDATPEPYSAPYRDCAFRDFPNLPIRADQNRGLARMFESRAAKLGYSSLITAADANIGRIVRRLDSLGWRDNTVIVFAADQGWNAGHHGVWGKGNGTVPFNMLEESIRVPLIWNHPGRIAPGTPDALVSSYDFFPTLLDYLGIELPPPEIQRVGRSYAPVLLGQPRPSREERTRLYFEYAYVRAVRTRNLKYVERADGFPSELFDLEADPGETRNVWKDPAYRRQREALRRELSAYFGRIGAPALQDWRTTTRQHLTVYQAQVPQAQVPQAQ